MTTQALDATGEMRKPLVNRFDSPWFNPRFLTGTGMVLLVVLVGLLGPLAWDTDLSLVASSPLNLPPMWVQRDSSVGQAGSNDAANGAVGQPTPETASGFGSGGLGGSGLGSLMTTQTVPDGQPTPETASGFGEGGLGGSGLGSLMTTPLPSDEEAAPASGQPSSTTGRPATLLSVTQPNGSPAHPLGTDNSGRDMLAVLLVGAPASLRVGVLAAAVGLILGVFLGFSAGFMGGWVDSFVRTASDVWLTIPNLAVLLVVSAYMRRMDLDTMALLLALFAWPGPARLLRAQVLTMRERGYVRMARLSGQSTFNIMFREMMPNLLPYLAASFAGNVSGAILAAASLEALGLGPTRYPTLGTTIFHSLRSTAILRGMWWWWGMPVLTLVFIFSALFLIAVGLDEIANPRLRGVQAQS